MKPNLYYKYKNAFFIILFIIFYINLSATNHVNSTIPIATEGRLDISDWNYNQKGAIKVNGEWEFYWNQLLSPNDFTDSNRISNKRYINVPGSWTNSLTDSSSLPNSGYGTYRLIIETGKKHSKYALKINDIYTSYKLWINGEEINEVGMVGESKFETKPRFYSAEYPIFLNRSEENIEILIQVSNFHHVKGGLVFPIFFGNHESVIKNTKNTYVLNLIIIGIILIIGLNHLMHYFLRREDTSNLYFGLLCIVMILRNITTKDRILSYWIPSINWELLTKLDNFSGFGTIAFFSLFLYVLFKKDFSKYALYMLVSTGILISLIIFIFPPLIANRFQLFYELYVLIGGLYLTFIILLKAAIRKREGAFLTFIGFIILYSTAIHDVLVNMGVGNSAFLAQYGLVIYMVIQSFILNQRSANALSKNEELREELNTEKQGLKNKIKERTDELFLQNRELIKLRRKEERRNWYNEGYAMLSDILTKEKGDLTQLPKKILLKLLKHLNAQTGLIYIQNEDDKEKSLELIAHYGCDKNTINQKKIMPGEGLVGTCYKNNETIHLSAVPENYIKVSSGMGESKPYSAVIVPMQIDNIAYGVIEIASFNKIKDYELELIENIASNIASTIQTLQINNHSKSILSLFEEQKADLQEIKKEMTLKDEEIRVLKEELSAKRKD